MTTPAQRAAEKIAGILSSITGCNSAGEDFESPYLDEQQAAQIITAEYEPVIKQAREAHGRTLKLLCDCVLFIQGKAERPDLKEIEKAMDEYAQLRTAMEGFKE
jgi:hypothetical protein